MKKWALIAGGAGLLLIAAIVVYKMTRPVPAPPLAVVEKPKGPDLAHLAKVAELARRIDAFEAEGRFKDALTLLKELAALEPSDPRPASYRPRLEEKQKRLDAWLGALKRVEAERVDALRRNTTADWQKVIEAAGAAEQLATSDAERGQARALLAGAKQQLAWGQAREEEKKGKLDAAIALAAEAVAAAEAPPELAAYKAALERRKRKQDYDRAAYAARGEGSPVKAHALWLLARPLAEEAKDVAEADGRLHALKPWVDPAERESRYDAALKAGDAALAAGELEAAEKGYKEAQGLKVTEARPSQGLARVSAARNAKAVDAHLAAAKEAEDKKEWADAIEALDKALRIRAGDAALAARRKTLEDVHRPPKIQIRLSESTGVVMEFLLVKRGRFVMGDPQGGSDEKPREVEIAKDLWLQTTETTQAQWEVVMGTRPWLSASVPHLPVEGVSWDETQKFLAKLNTLAAGQLRGRRAALPSEAEWEYACRAGTTTRWSFGNDESQFDIHGWNAVNSPRAPQPVGKKRPNAWGLFDMHGNVAEWCVDEVPGAVEDAPRLRVLRGGSWNEKSPNCRSSKREKAQTTTSNAFVGLRTALRPPP